MSCEICSVELDRQTVRPSGPWRLITGVIAQWRAAHDAGRAEAALRALDDRLLADIGIAREDIGRRVRSDRI